LGAKSKMKTIQNAHNGPIFRFHMEVIAYQRSLGKEKIISSQGHTVHSGWSCYCLCVS
jgi:hypothetical protein